MLALPERNFNRSVQQHNVDLVVLADWVEASVAFHGDGVSKSDVVDALCEGHVYAYQDYAYARVDEAWQLLAATVTALGNSSSLVDVQGKRVVPNGTWKDRPATAFALALSIAPLYDALQGKLKNQYARQGALFEQVAEQALRNRGWQVQATGWQAGQTATRFTDLVEQVRGFLHEPNGSSGAVARMSHANDAGLDLVCRWSFGDRRPAVPAMLVQCASGSNWREKLHTPSIDRWQQCISFIAKPTRAIVIPFLLDDRTFIAEAMNTAGVLIDRSRLLRNLPDGWLDNDTQDQITDWLADKIRALPSLND